jgi:hypothetical protein
LSTHKILQSLACRTADQEPAAVESFWQGLKFVTPQERRRLAALQGVQARREGQKQAYDTTLIYAGQCITVGTWAHWQLMEQACWAKFTQNSHAREALLATGQRPLQHRARRDSKTIPGVIMADIWMRLRHVLQHREASVG